MRSRASTTQAPKPATPAADQVVRLLLRYYRREARHLPWRRTTDPYAIWVSEIMLQQTQVATVIPYFERWMSKLPDLRSVAVAPTEKLLQLWAGLGYYARPRRLQTAARQLLERFPKGWPRTVEEWKSLVGVGDYTAGAICSIAFNQPAAAVDGNVTRVLSRLWGWPSSKSNSAHRRRLWELAQQLAQTAARLPANQRRNCADFNQALMELGALYCTARRPRCEVCPLTQLCVARRLGNPMLFPAPDSPKPAALHRLRVWLFQQRGRVLVRPETGHGWNRGLWQFPTERFDPAHPSATTEAAGEGPSGQLMFRTSHAITRHRFQVEVCKGDARHMNGLDAGGGKWLRLSELSEFPLSGLHRKIARRLTAQAWSKTG